MPSRLPSRRDLLARGVVVLPTLAAARLLLAGADEPPTSKPTRDYAARETFDALDAAWNNGNANADKTNENGALAWGEGYALRSYILMYQAHRDPRYLDKVIDQFDQVLRSRDSARGLNDYRGLSLRAWHARGKYTCGSHVLTDAEGRPALEVRSSARPAQNNRVTVARGMRDGTFKLICSGVTPTKEKVTDIYDNLTMDRWSENYAPSRLRREFADINGGPAGTRTMITARDPRPREEAADVSAITPAPGGPFTLVAQPYIYAVHTGMLTYPIAVFVRLVQESPDLKRNERYAAKAEEYLDAIEQAVAVCDHEWRENKETGEGWYIWAKGAPNLFDGSDQAHNQYLSLGYTLIELARITPNADRREACRDKAAKMARTFRNDLKDGASGGFTWSYFWTKGRAYNGWTLTDDVSEYQPAFVHNNTRAGYKAVEDTSHAHLDVGFAVLACQNKLGVFDARDMQRLCTTLTKTIFTEHADGTPTTHELVDGTGPTGAYDDLASGWLPLARYNPAVFDAFRASFNRRQPTALLQSALFGSANLNLIAQTLGNRAGP